MTGKYTNNTIKILPDFIANQIAAGEVVQRPESVVKELVENSLDSGADSIAVFVRDAGKQLILIVDNGIGMDKENLLLSVKRHATSKIFTSEDLEEIATFGFRGEALASIAAVANLEIRTRLNPATDDSKEETLIGWKLLSEPMKEERIEPCTTDYGTQIYVRNLFYNVPARRKFLKSNITEFRYISDTMIRFALSHPQIRFTFYDEDTLIFDAQPSTLEGRIAKILGDETSGSIIPVDHANDYIGVSGYVGMPHLAKQTSSGQYLFLNGRTIKSRSLNYAVFSAFEHLLEKNRNPLFIINLKIDPKLVDINVHPQKQEVKFEDERYVFNTIHKAVAEGLKSVNLIPAAGFSENEITSPFQRFPNRTEATGEETILVNKVTGEIIEPTYANPAQRQENYNFNRYHETDSHQRFSFHPAIPSESAFDAVFGKPLERPASSGTNENAVPEMFEFRFWQLHNKYIFSQTGKGVMLIDQHAAHERILYEKAVKALNNDLMYSQELLFPVSINLTINELMIVKELSEELTKLGYRLIFKGSDLVEIHSVPHDIKSGEETASFKEIINQFDENRKIGTPEKRDNLAASFSCKAAIKTGKKLNNDEIRQLLKDLFACSVPYVCPHGRPVIIELSLDELDKMFRRK